VRSTAIAMPGAIATTVASVEAAAVSAPTIPAPVQAAIPAKAEGPAKSKVGIAPPAPDPRRRQPRPAVARVVHIGIWIGIACRAFVDVLIAIGHPNPAILTCVDPLTCPCRLACHHRLLSLESHLGLGWRRWRLKGWCRRLVIWRGCWRLHRLWQSLIGPRDAKPCKQETNADGQDGLHDGTSMLNDRVVIVAPC
jgi:hypothetical protein